MADLDVAGASTFEAVSYSDELAALELRAARLGLTTPQSFLMMMRDESWQRIPSSLEASLALGNLLKVYKEAHHTGYMVQFL